VVGKKRKHAKADGGWERGSVAHGNLFDVIDVGYIRHVGYSRLLQRKLHAGTNEDRG